MDADSPARARPSPRAPLGRRRPPRLPLPLPPLPLEEHLPLPRFWAMASSIGAQQISFHPTTSSDSTGLDCRGLEIHPPDPDLDRFLLLVNLLGLFLQLILGAMADSGARRQPTFTKVGVILHPWPQPHNQGRQHQDGPPERRGPKGRQMRIAKCLVGDETGIVVFTARNDQVDVMKPGATVELRNAKIDMFKGSMHLLQWDKWGIVKAAESPSEFTVEEDNSLSLIEFELVTVVE